MPLPVGRQFPFPPPLISRAGQPSLVEAGRAPFTGAPLAQGPRRTSTVSQTNIATAITDLEVNHEDDLTHVYRSKELWGLFVQYALAPGQRIRNPTGYIGHESHGYTAGHAVIPPNANLPADLAESAWDPPAAAPRRPREWQLPIAPAEQQANAVLSLAEHYSEHRRKALFPVLVNCEPAVQDEFLQQFLVPLGYVLQVSSA